MVKWKYSLQKNRRCGILVFCYWNGNAQVSIEYKRTYPKRHLLSHPVFTASSQRLRQIRSISVCNPWGVKTSQYCNKRRSLISAVMEKPESCSHLLHSSCIYPKIWYTAEVSNLFYSEPTSHFKVFCEPHIEVLEYEHYIINTNYFFINKNSNEKIGIFSFQPIGLYLQI